MRFGAPATSFGHWRILLLLAALCAVVIAKDDPKVTVSKFNSPPLDLGYFEDSDVVLFRDYEEGIIYRSDNGGAEWKEVSDIPSNSAIGIRFHPFEPKTAFVLTGSETHYKTTDRGKSWTKFDSRAKPSMLQHEILRFNADDPDRIIFNGMNQDGIFFDEVAAYTTDGFESIQPLRPYTAGCWWAKSSKEFSTGDSERDKTRTMCILKDAFSLFTEQQRLVISDSYFKEIKDNEYDEFEPNMDTDRGVTGVVDLTVVKKYLLVATTSLFSDEMALYVTDDTVKWHRAIFPSDDSHDHSHEITESSYTVLESTNYSVQIDVMTSHPSTPMGVVFTSNSNGTYFTENVPYTNRNTRGLVDFEKISGIQGIFLVNTVENGKDVDHNGDDKKVVTQITFDDGRTFEPVKADGERIHLHSVTELDNIGRVFSSPAPGLVMGNGNTGDYLGRFKEADLYVSDDAGLTWIKALDGPHKFEFGDQGSVLVAVKDSLDEDISKFHYSLDHGKNWEHVDFPKDLKITPDILTTVQDSTSLKFILLGEKDETFHIIAIDFDGLHERKCGDDDMEDWHARVDEDGEETCIMGHKQTYRRRKKDAECFIESEFEDPVLKTEDCDCTDADFECDYNFKRDPDDHDKCIPAGPIILPDGACQGGDETFKGSSGWRKIPGNTCNRKDGDQKDDPVERKCKDSGSAPPPPASGDVSKSEQHVFDKFKMFGKIYLERGEKNLEDDETVITTVVDDDGKVKLWISTDHGKNWERILKDEDITGAHPHAYYKNIVFFTTGGKKVIYTLDRGRSFHTFDAPTDYLADALAFHPNKRDWIIWVGKECEKIGGKEECFPQASLSTDRGDNWKTVQRYAEKCRFTGQNGYTFRSLQQIVCLARKEERNDGPFKIVVSDDFFLDDPFVFEGDVTNFAIMSEFIILAMEDADTKNLHAFASLDGKHFEQAQFPYNFHEEHNNKYTVLDSSGHAVNLFVLTEDSADREMGSIIRSNSNGTTYVLSAPNVNCNEEMYVDFEKVSGLEGVTLINTVVNAGKKDKTKQLQTRISHNDGSEWGYLAPPSKDVDGKSYKCSGNGDASCALHLHHYTERDDKQKTFAASTAVGLLFGIGNVGQNLGKIEEADTFMTTDGGVTWNNVKKGHWTWQYGDQGSIIVLVQRKTRYDPAKTNMVSYSTDEGKTWKDFQFTDEEVEVMDITTLRSGTSRNFLLWCLSDDKKLFSVNLDFTGLTDQACEFIEGSSDSDYYLWSPKHPLQDDDCLFGHVAQYLRKKTDRKCYNNQDLQPLFKYKDCECSRRDYECDYNYALDNHGQCSLVQGLDPISGKEWCEQNNETTWYEPTGYRKVPLSTCKGGRELDKTSTPHPCEGYEEEFARKHRTSGVAIFFAVVIPIALAGCIGWYIYRNFSGNFGQIRLGESSASTFDSDQPWVKYPVVAISAVGAVVATLPSVAASLWRAVSGPGGSRGSWFSGGPRRFTTRDSFARGRGDYAVVDDVEGELLGDDSDDEM